MFVLKPDPYLLPTYRISPFQTKDIHTNNQLPDSNSIDDYFNNRFKGQHYHYLQNGRKAIHIALQQYQFQPDDVVTIFTTSGNFYISSCVTKEIEKFCRWSRKIEDNSKLIFINHEFGYPFKEMDALKKYNLPIIEDCCHSFFSTDKGMAIGNKGDFTIYSFPKIFPLQIGGLLISRNAIAIKPADLPDNKSLRYIKNVLSNYIPDEKKIIAQRIENYHYLKQGLNSNHFEERFELGNGILPGVFMFRVKDAKINLPVLKEYLYAHGIQCSIFYGEESFFIPVHQNLTEQDLDYFIEVIHSAPKTD